MGSLCSDLSASLCALAAAAMISGCASPSRTNLETGVPPDVSQSASLSTPVIFVHGNGDTAALWHTTIWRFESNGYPRDRLFAIDFRYPQSRADDAVPMEGRSSTADQMRELAAYVDDVRAKTRAGKVALVASSRGANTVRNYIRNGGGEATV